MSDNETAITKKSENVLNNVTDEINSNDSGTNDSENNSLSDTEFSNTDKDDDLEKQAEVLQITKEFQENVIKYVKW